MKLYFANLTLWVFLISLNFSTFFCLKQEIKIHQFSKRKLTFSKVTPNDFTEADLNMCGQECDKLSKIFGCYCDPDCEKYSDCCKIYIPKCANYFSELKKSLWNAPKNSLTGKKKPGKGKPHSQSTNNNSTSPSTIVGLLPGSCCSDTEPTNCFCDDRCVLFGDCCDDYKKCDNNQSNTSKRQVSISKRVQDELQKKKNENKLIKVAIQPLKQGEQLMEKKEEKKPESSVNSTETNFTLSKVSVVDENGNN